MNPAHTLSSANRELVPHEWHKISLFLPVYAEQLSPRSLQVIQGRHSGVKVQELAPPTNLLALERFKRSQTEVYLRMVIINSYYMLITDQLSIL